MRHVHKMSGDTWCGTDRDADQDEPLDAPLCDDCAAMVRDVLPNDTPKGDTDE